MAHIKQSETTYMFIFSKVSSVNYMLLVTVPVINNLICAEETTKLFCIQSISFDYGILCIRVTILCFRKSCQTQLIQLLIMTVSNLQSKNQSLHICSFFLVYFTECEIWFQFVILKNLRLCVYMLRIHSLSHNASCVNSMMFFKLFPWGQLVH